jgi:hypothetical protein
MVNIATPTTVAADQQQRNQQADTVNSAKYRHPAVP